MGSSPRMKLPKRALKPHEFAQYPVLELSAGASRTSSTRPGVPSTATGSARCCRRQHDRTARADDRRVRHLTLVYDYVKQDVEAGLLRVVKTDPRRLLWSTVPSTARTAEVRRLSGSSSLPWNAATSRGANTLLSRPTRPGWCS